MPGDDAQGTSYPHVLAWLPLNKPQSLASRPFIVGTVQKFSARWRLCSQLFFIGDGASCCPSLALSFLLPRMTFNFSSSCLDLPRTGVPRDIAIHWCCLVFLILKSYVKDREVKPAWQDAGVAEGSDCGASHSALEVASAVSCWLKKGPIDENKLPRE